MIDEKDAGQVSFNPFGADLFSQFLAAQMLLGGMPFLNVGPTLSPADFARLGRNF